MDCHQKVKTCENRRESGDEYPNGRQEDIAVCISAAVWRIKSPAGINAAKNDRRKGERSTNYIDIPTQKIDSRESQIPCTDHQRNKEIAKHSRNGWNQKEEDHDDAVHGEHFVVCFRLHEIALGSQ